MPALNLGTTAITSVQLGTTPINAIYLGTTPVWSRAAISDPFSLDGFLQGWINELIGGGLFSDGLGGLFDGSGLLGSLVGFISGGTTSGGIGSLLSNIPTSLEDAYCDAIGGGGLGGLTGGGIPDGLIGLLNGLPVIGGKLTDLFKNPLSTIESIVGTVPVLGNLGQLIGLTPDSTGALADPINFIVDDAGQVIGKLTCGQYQPNVGSDADVGFVIGIAGRMARMLIPDGLVSLGPQTSRFRHPTQTAGDDGYLEVRVANVGSPGFATQAFRRYLNAGTGASGVGMDFRDSSLSIVRRVASTNTLIVPNAARFVAGDVARLVQAGDVHTLYLNGDQVGTPWNDSGHTAAKGSNNRSVAMIMQGAKDLLGPRRFSPAFDHLEAA